MKLTYAPPSPFVRKVRVCLKELGIENQVELVESWVTPVDETNQAMALNPLGKIPALVREDGPAIYDSRVITRYLDDLAGGGRLYPTDDSLWEVLTLEAMADGIMDAAILMVYEGRIRAKHEQSAKWVDAQWGKITRGLNALEDSWMSHLTGPINMSVVSAGIALEYLDFRLPDRDWRESRAALTAWQKKFSDRPSMQETRPE